MIQNKTFKLIWFLIRQYKLKFLIVLALSIISGALEAANVAAIYPILNAAFPAGGGQGNIILTLFNRIADILPLENRFIGYCIIFLIISLLTFVAIIAFITLRVKLSASIVQNKQKTIFEKLIKADYQYFIDHKQGELLYNIVSAPGQVAVLISSIAELAQQAILSISIVFLLFSLSWQGTVAVLLVGLGYHYMTVYLGKKVSYYSATGELKASREANVIINEMITGIKQIKVYGTAAEWMDGFGETIKKRWYHYTRRNIWQSVPSPFLYLILYIVIGGIALFIQAIASTSFMELIPMYGTFGFAIFRLFPVIGAVGNQIMIILGTLPNCEAVYNIEQDKITFIEDGSKDLSSFKSGIQFNNVTFSYHGRTRILEDISVTFEKGKTTAIVGRSGSGKTTIINLLLRLFEPEKGEIIIDGTNIKEYSLISWLDKIGYVDQDTFIMNETIKNNITFKSGGYSDEDVFRAARYADAHDFTTEMTKGYDTHVGDKGAKLSGGQRQRIAVARAMIRKPEILIFDEATNALDSISEAAVQNAIDEISKDHTVIIIAHRLSTIVNADKIIVLSQGRVVEEGKHQELMKKKGPYWQLYQGGTV